MTPDEYRTLADWIESGGDEGVSSKPTAIAALRDAADQLESFESLIDVLRGSPHDSGCQKCFLSDYRASRCTCWKAELPIDKADLT
jgi:hypothetical protein